MPPPPSPSHQGKHTRYAGGACCAPRGCPRSPLGGGSLRKGDALSKPLPTLTLAPIHTRKKMAFCRQKTPAAKEKNPKLAHFRLVAQSKIVARVHNTPAARCALIAIPQISGAPSQQRDAYVIPCPSPRVPFLKRVSIRNVTARLHNALTHTTCRRFARLAQTRTHVFGDKVLGIRVGSFCSRKRLNKKVFCFIGPCSNSIQLQNGPFQIGSL